MPNVAIIEGVKINMYFTDEAPPHVHAVYGEQEVKLAIDDARVIAGEMKANKLAVAQAYVLANGPALVALWVEYGGAE